MKALIVYYSYGGNTRGIAQQLQEQLGVDIAEIETVAPYTGSYDEIVSQGQDEVDRGYMPDIKPLKKDPADYDTIILGTPVWWYTFAPAVKTFLARYDLSGKTVYPFMTNGGWIGHTEKDIATACPKTTVKKGINVKFDGNTLSVPTHTIQKWADLLRKVKP